MPPAVLIVDDNPLIVNVLKSLLAAERFDVCVSNNGEEALSVLGARPIDVIICDIMMPRMDGYELHQVVRQRPELSHIPFIFLSALNDNNEVSRGLESGVDDYLVKPFEPRMLIALVKGKIKRSRTLKTMSEQRYESYRRKVVHTLSHEFRTPLVAINTGSELLIEQKEQLDIKRMRELIEAIRRGGLRLERLVNDFMLLQQIEAGIAQRLFETRKHPQVLSSIIEDYLRSFGDELQNDGFRIKVLDTEKSHEALIYGPQITDILSRFINNAVKFKAQDLTIEIHHYVKNGEVILEVRDRGIGIDITRVKEALAAFGQLDRDKLEQQGSGLGLAIASRYAQIHGGRIEFENREGGGSIVRLVLPIHRG